MENTPKMMTIREIARTGLLTDHALRRLLKAGQLPAVYIGKKDSLESDVPRRLDTNQFFN